MKLIKVFLLAFVFFGLGNAGAFSPGDFFADGSKSKKAVALTFDDGPGQNTVAVLAILDRYQIKATFFMNGDQVEFRPRIAEEVLKHGHEIADHTYSHMNFYAYEKKFGREKAESKIAEEIIKSKEQIVKATGTAPRLCRMPHGYYRPWLKNLAKEHGYCLVNWTFGEDWLAVPKDKMVQDYIKQIRPGAILLFHDGGKNRTKTIQSLPLIIEEAKKRGYSFLMVSEILE